MHFLLLMFLVLVCKVKTDSLYYAAITECSNNSTYFSIAKGQPLRLCCYLSKGQCRLTTYEDSLSLVPEAGAKEHLQKQRMSRVDRCAVMYEVKRANVSDSGNYICYKNNESSLPFMREHVYVLDKPKKPKHIKVIYFEANSTLAVSFNKGEVSGEWFDDYEVRLDYRYRDKVLFQPICPQNTTQCYSYYQEKNLLSEAVNLTVNVSRPTQEKAVTSSSQSEFLNLYQHIRPRPVESLFLRSINSSVAIVQFKLLEETKKHIPFMNHSGRPLCFKISLSAADGPQRSFLLLMRFKKTVYKLSKRPEQNVAVVFQDLAPNTKYTVSVSGVGGGGEGKAKSRGFSTNKSVPIQPPVVHPSAFSLLHNGTCLLLFWKPLPGAEKGGDYLQYKAEVIGPDDKPVVVNTTEAYLNEKLAWRPHSINIWAVNEVGESQSHSQIIIPEKAGSVDVTTLINMDRDRAEVYLMTYTNQHTQSFAIHWCDSEKSQVCKTVDICKGTLHTQHFNLTDTGQIHNFSILLGPACKKFTSETKRKVTYIDFESMGDETVETRTAKANVTETEYRLVYPDNEETGETCTDTDSITKNVGPKAFFVSIKDKDDKWMGMRPARCYYYNDASTVDIEISPTFDSQKAAILNIQQRCDGPESKTKQFLVKKYEIYSSKNNTCTVIDKLAEFENDLFTAVSYKLPPVVLHVCVKAIGQFTSFSVPKSIEFPRVTEKDQTILIYIFVGVLAFVFIIIGCVAFIYLFKKCHDRENHFKKLWRFNSLSYHVIKSCNGKSPESITSDSGLESSVNTDSETNGSTSLKADRTEPACQSIKSSSHQSTDSGCPIVDFSQTPPSKHQFIRTALSTGQCENCLFLKDCADSGFGGKTLASAGSRLGGGSHASVNIRHGGSAQESENCSHAGSSQEPAIKSHRESIQESAKYSHSQGSQEPANNNHSGSTQESFSSDETSVSGDNSSRSHCSDIEGRKVSSSNYGHIDKFSFVPPEV